MAPLLRIVAVLVVVAPLAGCHLCDAIRGRFARSHQDQCGPGSCSVGDQAGGADGCRVDAAWQQDAQSPGPRTPAGPAALPPTIIQVVPPGAAGRLPEPPRSSPDEATPPAPEMLPTPVPAPVKPTAPKTSQLEGLKSLVLKQPKISATGQAKATDPSAKKAAPKIAEKPEQDAAPDIDEQKASPSDKPQPAASVPPKTDDSDAWPPPVKQDE